MIFRMPYTKVWIHLIWSTKNRQKIITEDLRKNLLEHIKENCCIKGIHLDSINCLSDHIHVLISLHPDQNISKVVQLIKGESSYWINKTQKIRIKFEWQSEYMAVSVSESNIEKVRRYIFNQHEHHREKSYVEEYNELLEKSGFKEIIQDYLE